MLSTPTVTSFQLLLSRLDSEPEQAAVKYEELRLRITKILQWKGCPESRAEALADTTIDRIAKKLGDGENIENLNAYAAGVVRFVWLEYCRTEVGDTVDELPETAVQPDLAVFDDVDERVGCLRKCLIEIAPADADRRLIVGYYDTESNEKNKDVRKMLAESLGLSMSALRVRACRLRARLEMCINDCIGGVTDRGKNDTLKQEAL
jgi:DNA-directed RNA polymerase specialized sigma24 family protein